MFDLLTATFFLFINYYFVFCSLDYYHDYLCYVTFHELAICGEIYPTKLLLLNLKCKYMFVFIRTVNVTGGFKNIILLFYTIMVIFVVNVYLSHTDQYYFIVFI